MISSGVTLPLLPTMCYGKAILSPTQESFEFPTLITGTPLSTPLFGLLLDIGHSFSQCYTKEDLLGRDSGKAFVFILKKRSKKRFALFFCC